jgi:hypothetical protein
MMTGPIWKCPCINLFITHLKLACEPILQKINTLCEKASIEVEGKHFDLDILMGGDNMKFLQLVLGLGGSLCNYSCH